MIKYYNIWHLSMMINIKNIMVENFLLYLALIRINLGQKQYDITIKAELLDFKINLSQSKNILELLILYYQLKELFELIANG